ncbi:hypothetical protein [Limobrevibacterium gyesilva]|uniref:Uncharacterized protein n=1 Tax=Limobrevibacterium gyesilva TaxID=2991712 RepID=A0AA42CIB5_9PROT|nr:hypothetical protein [Limobrevibacterium gyesilva]MCW3475715.1 hypothetical protein [Limobrevibacterium gyesilva]
MTFDRFVPQHHRERAERAFRYVQRNPQMGLSVGLFCVGAITVGHFPPLAGALFGAGASLLGAWITELHNRSSQAARLKQLQNDARKYLALELYRTIERVLYIHERAIPNFTCASAENGVKPNDLQDDFIPYWPVLYPNAQQFRDLPGDEAVALVSFYDSLHALGDFVKGWWEREGQLPVSIFNMILHHADKSLKLAQVCIEKFELEKSFPPPYEAWGTISSRIARSLKMAEGARTHHIARFEAKAGKGTPPATQQAIGSHS